MKSSFLIILTSAFITMACIVAIQGEEANSGFHNGVVAAEFSDSPDDGLYRVGDVHGRWAGIASYAAIGLMLAAFASLLVSGGAMTRRLARMTRASYMRGRKTFTAAWQAGPNLRAEVQPAKGIQLAGESFSWSDICKSILICGGIGSGKSKNSEEIIYQAIKSGCPMLAMCVKPDESERYIRLCSKAGASGRLRIVRPGSPYRLNILDYQTTIPGGSPQTAAQFIARLNDIALRSGGGGRSDDTFWKNLFDSAMLSAIDLAMIADGRASIDSVYEAISTSPATPSEACSDAYYRTKACGRMLMRADAYAASDACPDGTARRYRRAVDVLVSELSSIGAKARGAVLSMNNGLLARLTYEPFYEAMCTDTTLTPEIIDRDRLITVIDYPLLVHGDPARMYQLAWVMAAQQYCLRRDASKATLPFMLVRDEAGYLLHPEWDMQVQIVSRSQKLCHLDIIQDLDVLQACLGGSPKSKHEAMAFASNHMIKLLFQNNNHDTNTHFSQMIGDRLEILTTGSRSNSDLSGDAFDQILGSASQFGWNEQYQPYIRPGHFSRLLTGQAFLHLGGRTFPDGLPYKFIDFWRGNEPR